MQLPASIHVVDTYRERRARFIVRVVVKLENIKKQNVEINNKCCIYTRNCNRS